MNGMMSRDDWQDVIQLPLGLVPAGEVNGACLQPPVFIAHSRIGNATSSGSGNGLSRCIEGHTALSAVFNIIKAHTSKLDLFRVWQDGVVIPRIGFLLVHHGLIADIDIESEKYRWAGSARFTFSGLQRILNLRKYPVKMWYLPPDASPGFRSQVEGWELEAAPAYLQSQLKAFPRLAFKPDSPAISGWKVCSGHDILSFLS
jgi:sphingosine kinase